MSSIYKLNDEQIKGKLKKLFECQQDIYHFIAEQMMRREPFENIWMQKFSCGQYSIQFNHAMDFMNFVYTVNLLIKAYSIKELKDIEYAKVVEYCGKFNWYDEIMYLLFSELTRNRYHMINVMCELDKIGIPGARRHYLKEFTECENVDQDFKDEILGKIVVEKLSQEN